MVKPYIMLFKTLIASFLCLSLTGKDFPDINDDFTQYKSRFHYSSKAEFTEQHWVIHNELRCDKGVEFCLKWPKAKIFTSNARPFKIEVCSNYEVVLPKASKIATIFFGANYGNPQPAKCYVEDYEDDKITGDRIVSKQCVSDELGNSITATVISNNVAQLNSGLTEIIVAGNADFLIEDKGFKMEPGKFQPINIQEIDSFDSIVGEDSKEFINELKKFLLRNQQDKRYYYCRSLNNIPAKVLFRSEGNQPRKDNLGICLISKTGVKMAFISDYISYQ